jgi:hypothetical protein
MNNESPLIYSPLCQIIESEGESVKVDIYSDGSGGWILEVVDKLNNSTVWEDAFETDQAALDEVLDAIKTEGIGCLVGPFEY